MASKRKRAANRKNVQLSTGPTDTSKSRYNAVTHRITSKQAVVLAVDGPDATERFNVILDGLRRELCPQGTLEASLVDQIAMALLQQRRLLAYESAVIQSHAEASITKWIERSQIERVTIDLVEMEAALARLDEPEGLSEVVDPTFLVNFLQERWSVSGESVLARPSRPELKVIA